MTGALLALRLHFQPPTVPPYRLEGADDEATVLALHRGERFTMDLRPLTPPAGAIGARGFLLRGEQVRPWDATFEVARDGTVHVAGEVDTLFAGVPPGAWDVAIAVGRPEVLPTLPREVLRARAVDPDAGHEAWRLVRKPIRLED